jgi:ribosomal protein S18 acetylase RimI-like enzyme
VLVAEALGTKVRPAFGTRGAAALTALVRRDLARPTVRYLVADHYGAVVATARLALGQDQSAGLRPLAAAIGWVHTVRGALVLGLVAYPHLPPGDAYVEELAVEASHRRTGIGRALLAQCESVATNVGKHRMTLWVAADNAAAVALYRSCGYTVLRTRRTLRGRLLFKTPVALLMAKALHAPSH